MSKDTKGSCRSLYMRGHGENVTQTMETDVVNYFKRQRDIKVKLNGVVVFGYSLTRRPRRVVMFCDCILRCCALYPDPDTVEWRGVGLITFLGARTPT